ncbi:MAG TPA: gamma carbonic anhydrase family protein [Thermohalobaculum sp.]|nr:gamma carbonic anhydrase family protein [Thermohalobaculum sp.]
MTLYALDGRRPALAADAYAAPGSRLIGDVTLGARASVWFNAVLRGDNEPIRIGEETNVQDGCALHTDPGFPLTLGPRVTVGHNAVVHGCTVGEGSLIGMGAIVMNGARIGRGCLVAAGALVPEGREIPDGMMAVGAPARPVRALDDAAKAGLLEAAAVYVDKALRYARDLGEA